MTVPCVGSYKKSLRIQPIVGPWLDTGQVSLFFCFVFINRDEFKVSKNSKKRLERTTNCYCNITKIARNKLDNEKRRSKKTLASSFC